MTILLSILLIITTADLVREYYKRRKAEKAAQHWNMMFWRVRQLQTECEVLTLTDRTGRTHTFRKLLDTTL